MAIPTDVRRFQLKHLLGLTLSFCVPLSLMPYLPSLALALVASVSFFWGGMGCLFISDTIDNGPIDERGWTSQFFNLIGLFAVAFCVIGFILFTLFVVVISLLNFAGQPDL